MAPRKEKVEKVSGEQAADTILRYLRKQNRPYSATDISANLHNAVSKAKTQMTLKELAARGDLAERTAGKQAVYHAVQDPQDAVSPERLNEMDNEIYAARDSINTLKAEQKTLQSTLFHLNSTPTTETLLHSIKCLEDEKLDLEGRLLLSHSDGDTITSTEEREIINKKYVDLSKRAMLRKEIFVTFWSALVDNLPEEYNGVDLWEQLGLEDDI